MARRAISNRMPLLVQRARPQRGGRSSIEVGKFEEAPSFDLPKVGFDEEEVPETDPEPSENFLARYFKEMAVLSVLKPEEEFEAAKRIEALELDLWGHILSYPQLVDPVLSIVEQGLEEEQKLKGINGLRRSAQAMRQRASVVARKRFSDQGRAMAKRVYALDVDRRLMFAVLTELRRMWGGEVDRAYPGRLRVNVRSKTFNNYIKNIHSQFSRAQQARNEFVKANLRLVVSIARRFNHGRMPLSDLIQEGNMGLIKAVERYDYRRGYRFSTYASWWIRHAISRALADKGRAVRLPVHMIDAYHKVARTRRELSSKLGRQPTSEEISSESGIACDKVRRLEGYLMEQAVSLDREVASDDGRKFLDFIPDQDAVLPSDSVMYQAMNDQVMELLKDLKPIEADILRKRFGLVGGREQTLKEIGEDYNLSRERIRQLQEQALGKIRRALQRQEAI